MYIFKNHKDEGKLAQLLHFYSAVHKEDCVKFSWLRFAHEVFAENKITTLKNTTTFQKFIIVPNRSYDGSRASAKVSSSYSSI
jgi:hypothetical protein